MWDQYTLNSSNSIEKETTLFQCSFSTNYILCTWTEHTFSYCIHIMLYHLNYSIIVMTRDIYQSNICDPSWQINHLGTTLQSRLAHRLAYRQLLMSRPHLINRIWFRCECAGLFPVTRILSPRTIHNYDYNKFITTRVIFHRGRFLASTHLFDLYRKLGCVRTCERVFCW